MPPPHQYVPAHSPIFAPPGSAPQAVRLEAVKAVLDGVPTGAYDEQVMTWLSTQSDPTVKTLLSLMWRCRETGMPPKG
jgi:hypothetical protein